MKAIQRAQTRDVDAHPGLPLTKREALARLRNLSEPRLLRLSTGENVPSRGVVVRISYCMSTVHVQQMVAVSISYRGSSHSEDGDRIVIIVVCMRNL